MIEDKKLGLKVAENPEEAYWEEMKTRMNKDIEANKHNIEISKHILTLAEQKLKEKAWKVK
jgi:hypothetical protein